MIFYTLVLKEISLNHIWTHQYVVQVIPYQYARMESIVAMVIILLNQVWQISPFCLVARQPSLITSISF